tara:strand:+ start:189 stop:710 length:522 start_codon:yes stop_codon:yes gene_type:complete
LNFIITCQRNLEYETIEEIARFLDKFGDSNAKISKTPFSGIIELNTLLDIFDVIKQFRVIIDEEPWSIRFCSRIIPIQQMCKSELKSIKECIQTMTSRIEKNQSYRISIEKRNSDLKSRDLISEIADLIPNKVSLENADWEIIIQVMGVTTGIGILPKNSIISVSKEKRLGSH